MWRIGSQIPPSRMMMPVVVVTGAAPTVGEGAEVAGAGAAEAGPLNANAAATAAHGSASARSRREDETDGMGGLPFHRWTLPYGRKERRAGPPDSRLQLTGARPPDSTSSRRASIASQSLTCMAAVTWPSAAVQ